VGQEDDGGMTGVHTSADAELKISQFKREVAETKAQLQSTERRVSMTQQEYDNWSFSAKKSIAYKEDVVRRLSTWAKVEERREKEDFEGAVNIPRTLKLAAKQYGYLLAVLVAADDYLGSTSAEAREETQTELQRCVHQALKEVRFNRNKSRRD